MTQESQAPKPDALAESREEFINQWGILGNAWGVNRTMAQIHALLMVSTEPLSTDQVMEELQISRGNAHSNIKELVGWNLVRTVIVKGERKEFFEAEKDVWKIACTVGRERKRRELEPALRVLESCAGATKKLKSAEAQAFHDQIAELREVVSLFDRVLEHGTKVGQSKMLKIFSKFLP